MAFNWKDHPLALFVAGLTSIHVIRKLLMHRKGRLPPGPTGIPIFGNLFQLSTTVWIEFEKWKKSYGSVVYISAVGQGMIILNSHTAAADLLDRRANIYSDRPRLIVASEILTGGLLVVFAKQNNIFKRMRRAGHEGLNKSVVPSFHPVQIKEALGLTEGLLRNQDNWDEEFRRAAASMILSVVYDVPAILSCDDPLITKINDFVRRLVLAAFPGAHFVEVFTWMKYLPSSIAKWKKNAEEGYEKYSNLFEGLFKEVEDRINKGDERPSFTASLIRQRERHRLSDREAAWLSATMYAAGSETTSAVLSWFMLAMLAYPEVQKRCQDELDAIVGRSRMPNFEDRDSLPYIRATVREALRWRPALPLGVQHYTTEDDWYQGYFIPKGTICLANIWSLNRDPGVYGLDADHFNPGRFIDHGGELIPAPVDTKEEGLRFPMFYVQHLIIAHVISALSGHVAYGFGHRICPGRHIANESIFINIVSLLWTANISPVKDINGQFIIPDVFKSVNTGMVVRPEPFKCSITYRFPEAEGVLAHTRELNP